VTIHSTARLLATCEMIIAQAAIFRGIIDTTPAPGLRQRVFSIVAAVPRHDRAVDRSVKPLMSFSLLERSSDFVVVLPPRTRCIRRLMHLRADQLEQREMVPRSRVFAPARCVELPLYRISLCLEVQRNPAASSGVLGINDDQTGYMGERRLVCLASATKLRRKIGAIRRIAHGGRTISNCPKCSPRRVEDVGERLVDAGSPG